MRFDEDELAAGADREPPEEPLAEAGSPPSWKTCGGVALVILLILAALILAAVRRHRARLARRLGRRG